MIETDITFGKILFDSINTKLENYKNNIISNKFFYSLGKYVIRYLINIKLSNTANNIVVTSGDGIAGNPVIDLAVVTQTTGGSFVKVTLDVELLAVV